MNEQGIQSKIIAYLKSRNIYYVKTIVCSKAGTPDIIACDKGRFIAVEVKAEKGTLTPLQARTLDEIQNAGGRAIVARSVEDVRKWMEETP